MPTLLSVARPPSLNAKEDPYGGYETARGRRAWRPMRPFWGMYHDVRRRLPYYGTDIVDGLNYRTFAGTVRIFFVNIMPAIAFILDMGDRTNGFFGINEALLASAMAAILFSLLSSQPLTVVGITGLISLFNYTIFDIVQIYDAALYPQVMVWVGIWAAIFHWLVAIFNLCDYMRYVTDFSSESFGAYVSIIYLEKAVNLLVVEFDRRGSSDGFMSVVIALLFFGTVYWLENMRLQTILTDSIRNALADYAYPIATIFWTGFSHIPGTLRSITIDTLQHTPAFQPTVDRPWVVDFWNLEAKWVFVALPFGFLMMLLFYYDHNVSSIAAQAKQFPLRKPGGFHWDFFLMGCSCFVAGVLNIPLPNGLVPQAPVHTDCVTVYQTDVQISKTDDGEERRDPVRRAVEVKEQRVSHFVMGLALFGMMTGPLLIVLHTIPRGLFAGVFAVVGWGGIEGNGIVKKLLFLMREPRFVSSTEKWLNLPKKRIGFYIFWQCLGVALSVAISQTIAAIGFPVLIIALIPLRWKLLPKMFSPHELRLLDEPTATSEVVLASLGGRPVEKYEEEMFDPTNDGSIETISTVRRRVPQREADEESQRTTMSREAEEKDIQGNDAPPENQHETVITSQSAQESSLQEDKPHEKNS